MNGTKVLPDIISVEMTKDEARTIIRILSDAGRDMLERASMLSAHIPRSPREDLHPNRALANSWNNQAEALAALVYRMRDQL